MEEQKNPNAGAQPAPMKNNFAVAKLDSPPIVIGGAIALAILLFFSLDVLFSALTHEKTDDAFIAGHIVSIAPRISGQVSGVYVLDNQLVHSNQLLVEIDPNDYATALAQKKAANTSQESNFKAAVAGYKLMGVKVATAKATAKETKAAANAAAATATNATANFKRAQDLVKQNTISQQEFEQFKTAADAAQANFESAQQKAASDESKITEAQAQLEAAKAESETVFSQVGESKTAVEQAQLNFSYTKIFAPCDGRVTRKQVEVGDYLQTGQTLFSIVPTEVWVVANFKESQLEKMKPGQKVIVSIDALGKKFSAHVESIQAGSGAAFSLLPPENATGNFVKVIQRVPVKILFDDQLPADKTIGPGLSVEPSVQVTSFAVPDFVTAILGIILAIAAAFIFKTIVRRKLSDAPAQK